jgi:hypothetical protein
LVFNAKAPRFAKAATRERDGSRGAFARNRRRLPDARAGGRKIVRILERFPQAADLTALPPDLGFTWKRIPAGGWISVLAGKDLVFRFMGAFASANSIRVGLCLLQACRLTSSTKANRQQWRGAKPEGPLRFPQGVARLPKGWIACAAALLFSSGLCCERDCLISRATMTRRAFQVWVLTRRKAGQRPQGRGDGRGPIGSQW